MVVIVMENQGADVEANFDVANIVKEMKIMPNELRVVNSSDELKSVLQTVKGDACLAPSELSMNQLSEELQISLKNYLDSLEAGSERDRFKLEYSKNNVKMKKLETFRDSINRQLIKNSDVQLPKEFISGANKQAVSFVNNKSASQIDEGVQVYEDLLNWVKASSEEAKEIRGKLWFNLATAYQKSAQPHRDKRRKALIAGLDESPHGSKIRERVANVLHRDFA